MSTDLMKGDLVRHGKLGPGRVDEVSGFGESQRCLVRFYGDEAIIQVTRGELELMTESETSAYELVKLALAEMRREEDSVDRLGERWIGGELVIKPRDPAGAEKTVPLEVFFHKIVMVRDRLRVLEQHLNAHKVLSDADKVELQQYITRIYGSLTTFNVLFREKSDWFVGQRGEE
jgi:hypothetical protein